MKSKLLVTTAALALMISAGAQAQTHTETSADQPAVTQNHNERGSATREMNRGDAPDTDRAKAGSTTGQAPAAGNTSSDSKAASDAKSGTGKPASAQDTSSPSHNNAAQSTPSDKAGGKTNATASDKSTDTTKNKTSAAKPDDKNAASSRSTQSNEPSSTKPNTAGQTDTKQPSAAQRGTTTDGNQATTNSKTNDTKSDDTKRAAATDTRSATRVSASLQTEQKTRLHQAITKLDVKPVTNVNFSVSVGTAVPRTVSLHRVPTTIVEIVPQYRDYDYFVVRDQVVIVQPETHKIVDVIERSGPSHASAGTTTRERRVNLSVKQRSYIRQHATSRRTTTTTTTTTGAAPRAETSIVVGEEVPSSVEIESFPADVYREVPTVREYRYIRSGSDVYLVDPGSRRVIEEIE